MVSPWRGTAPELVTAGAAVTATATPAVTSSAVVPRHGLTMPPASGRK